MNTPRTPGAGGQGGVQRVLTHLEGAVPSELMTSDNFNSLVGELRNNPNLFGSYAEALITHEDVSNFVQQLGTHIDFNSGEPLAEQIPRALQTLGTHEGGLQRTLTHEEVQQPGPRAEADGILQEGTVLGVDINAHNLNICEVLKYYKGTPVIYQFFQLIAWYYMGSPTGFTDEQIAKIRTAQVARTVKNMGEIKKLLDQRPIHNYNALTAEIAKKTGGLVLSVTHPVGKALKQLEDMVSLYDRCLERAIGNTPEEKASVLETALNAELIKGRELSEGGGFSALSWGLKRIALAAYEAEHRVIQGTKPGENREMVSVWVPDLSDQPSDDEQVARMVVACYKNGIQSADAIEAYFKGYPKHFRDRLAPILQQIVAEEHIIDPHEPKYDSSMGPKQIMDEELRACRLNMPAADGDSTSKIVDYLEDYRGISRDIDAKKADGTVERITEKEFHDFIRGAIGRGEMMPFEPARDIKMSPQKRLEEEFRAAQLNMPERDRNSPSMFMKYLEARGIYNVQVTRGTEIGKITERDVYGFIEKAIEQERLASYKPVYNNRMTPAKILKEEVRAAWFNMPKADRNSSNAVIKYLDEERKIRSVKATREGEEEAQEISAKELDDYIQNLVVEGKLGPYKPTYPETMSPEAILDQEFQNALEHMGGAKRYAGAFLMYLRRCRDLSDVKATRPGEQGARSITEREIYTYINKLIADGTFDALPNYNDRSPIGQIFEQELLMYWLNTPEIVRTDYNTVQAFKEHLVERNILNVKGIKVEDGVPEKITQAELDEFLGILIANNVMPAGRAAQAGGAPDVVPQAGVVPAARPQPGVGAVAGANSAQAVVRPEVLVALQQDWADTGQGDYSKNKESAFKIMTDVDATDEEFNAFFAGLKRQGNAGA